MKNLSTKNGAFLPLRKCKNKLITFLIFSSLILFFLPESTNACSMFFLRNGSHFVVGRNLDFSYSDYMISVNKRNVIKTAFQYEGEIVELPAVWTSKYASIASNMFAREIPADGMNEAGLVIGVAILHQTEHPVIPDQPSISLDQWVQYLLDNFATVEEVIASCSQINIRYNPGDYWRVHIFVTDSNGTSAVVEFLEGELIVHTKETLEVKAMTNSTYESSLSYYQGGVMSGASLSSLNRFFKVAEMLDSYNNEDPVDYAYQILDYTAQRHTQRRMVYDISNRRVYLLSLDNNNIRFFDFSSFSFHCEDPVMIYQENETDEGDITDQFIEYTTQINRDFIEIGWQFLNKTYTEEELTSFSLYPESFDCVPTYLAYWTGEVDNDWNNINNWEPSILPRILDSVYIQKGQENYPENNTGLDIDIAKMIVEEGAHIVIPVGTNLTINSDITLKSGSLGDANLINDGNLIVNGNTIVERYLKRKQFHYVSSPLTECSHNVYSELPQGGNNPNFYAFDEEDNSADWLYSWSNTIAVSGNLEPGKGYANYLDQDNVYELTGGTLNTGDINIDVSNSSYGIESDGWNLIGNPYPSGIEADEFIYANSSVINGTLYFWDDDNSGGDDYDTDDYACWNLAGAIGTGSGTSSGTGTHVPNGIVASGQGFFVKKTEPGIEALIFQNDMRTFGSTSFFKTTNLNSSLRLCLTNKSLKLYNEILLAFVNGASDEFDNLYDAIKLKGNKSIAFYSLLNKQELAIQSFTQATGRSIPRKIIPLGFVVNKSSDYTISFIQKENFHQNTKIYLADFKLKKVVDLGIQNDYIFYTDSGIYNDRFKIYINKKPGRRNSKKNVEESSVKIYSHRNILYLKLDNDDIGGEISVFDISGFKIDHFTINQTHYAIPVDKIRRMIVVHLKSKIHNISKSVVINQ